MNPSRNRFEKRELTTRSRGGSPVSARSAKMGSVPVRSFSLSAIVDASPERVIDFLMQLDAHRGMHPYLQSAQLVGSGVDSGDHPWWDWRIVERPALGPLRYTIRFPARMTREAETAMRGRVRAARGCWLLTATSAVAGERGTEVHETTTVTAPWPVVGYMTKHARIAHARTFAHLPAELSRTVS
ncbi:hypothetical protein [Microbacterium rhizosphaerae]|uniref:SRPBCC family protein n=1 Tax=Microbacterium rhizosphaerae TaxID=1678237 RepID=A0ABZ0SQ68_9MICO|nr:hypothetical protein [Microbacterium rhizosphaerae]WPR91104.1 hypothetical protein SM116_07400 [Microbacterium rhizosphaerae]